MKNKTRVTIMYSIAVVWIILGLLLNHFNLGSENFIIYGSVGNWLIYAGFLGLIYATLRLIWQPRKKTVDERMHFIAAKALRITFLGLLIAAFVIILIDGIKPITTPYHLFMSYLVCGILIIYITTYKILLRFY